MIVDDKYVLEVERQRAKLVDNLRHQGVWVEDDATMEECILKMDKIPQLSALLSKTLEGEVYGDENVTTIPNYRFDNQVNLKKADFPYVTRISGYGFQNCSSLESVNLPLAESVEAYAFNSCRSLKTINLHKVKSVSNNSFNMCTSLVKAAFPNSTNIGDRCHCDNYSLICVSYPKATQSGSNCFVNNNELKILDIGNIPIRYNGIANILNVKHIILRNKLIEQTLTNASYVGGLFNTTGGRLFVPKNTFDYSSLPNWSSKVFIQVDIEGSRYEDENWLVNRELTIINVDGINLNYIPDDEVVSVFKYTEGFDHLYDEDGTEIPDDAIIGNYVGKLLTSEVA